MTTLNKVGTIMGLLGLAILLYQDWVIAAGVLILVWGNNMERAL